ncbi:hypothetical protein K525DRAFT_152155, partial [Schizophyllum commune Loenen D]
IGPFEVAQRISPNTYRLHMSDKYPGFPVFNISHLKLEKIVAHKWDKRKKKRVYKVRWLGFGEFYDTWQTEADLRNADEYLRSY